MTPPAFLRNVWSDLVEKRLWPVAIILVAALVALPLTLGRVGDAETPTGGAGVPAADGKTDFTAYDGVDAGKTSEGGDRDVFDAPGAAKPKADAAGGGAATGGTTGSTAGSADAGAGTSAGTGGAGWGADIPAGSIPGLDDVGVVPVGGADVDAPSDDGDELAAYSVDIKFGQGANLTARKNIARLTLLPSTEDPYFVFLGVLADGKTATFLVSSDAQATGDAKCLPSPSDCQRIEMEAGDTEFLDVVTPEGKTEQYQLDVTKVARTEKSTVEAAADARARESSQGRAILRAAVETKQVDVSDLAYSREQGVIVPSGAKNDAGSLFGGYRVDLRFGAPNQLVKRYNLARLTPLPSVESPSFVYLGVLADGERSIFLNPSGAAASGDAVCDPTPQDCKRVTLKAGDAAKFDVATMAGGATQYELAIDAITEIESDTPEEAAASRTRESEAGRIILRRLITEVGTIVSDLTFSPKRATVVDARPEQPRSEPQAAPVAGTEPEGASTAPAPGQ